MTPRWEDLGSARKRVRAADLLQNIEPWTLPESAAKTTDCIDLPPDAGDAELYFTKEGRLIALPKRLLRHALHRHVLKGLTVAGFVVLAAAIGAALA
jgi:hypothetical protein